MEIIFNNDFIFANHLIFILFFNFLYLKINENSLFSFLNLKYIKCKFMI